MNSYPPLKINAVLLNSNNLKNGPAEKNAISSSYPSLSKKDPTPFGSTPKSVEASSSSIIATRKPASSSSYPPMLTTASTPFNPKKGTS